MQGRRGQREQWFPPLALLLAASTVHGQTSITISNPTNVDNDTPIPDNTPYTLEVKSVNYKNRKQGPAMARQKLNTT